MCQRGMPTPLRVNPVDLKVSHLVNLKVSHFYNLKVSHTFGLTVSQL